MRTNNFWSAVWELIFWTLVEYVCIGLAWAFGDRLLNLLWDRAAHLREAGSPRKSPRRRRKAQTKPKKNHHAEDEEGTHAG